MVDSPHQLLITSSLRGFSYAVGRNGLKAHINSPKRQHSENFPENFPKRSGIGVKAKYISTISLKMDQGLHSLPISLLSCDGNKTKDLRVITGAAAIDGGAGGGTATGAGGGDTFLIQKFVKSKGPHAFIVRQVIDQPTLHVTVFSGQPSLHVRSFSRQPTLDVTVFSC